MDQLMYLLMSKIYYQLYHGNLKILGLFFFYFRLFNTCQENILYIALQITADLWYWKRPLCQVSNNIFQIFSKIDLWQANALIRFSSVLVIFCFTEAFSFFVFVFLQNGFQTSSLRRVNAFDDSNCLIFSIRVFVLCFNWVECGWLLPLLLQQVLEWVFVLAGVRDSVSVWVDEGGGNGQKDKSVV